MEELGTPSKLDTVGQVSKGRFLDQEIGLYTADIYGGRYWD